MQVMVDQVYNVGSLVATRALSSLCPSQLSSGNTKTSSCLLRYDIQVDLVYWLSKPIQSGILRWFLYCKNTSFWQSRTPVAGLSYEVVPGQAGASAAFMQGLLGSSNYAAELGVNFSALVGAKYGLRTRNKTSRAYWINPTVAWNTVNAVGKGSFSLTQVF
jgi:hypothetical protein